MSLSITTNVPVGDKYSSSTISVPLEALNITSDNKGSPNNEQRIIDFTSSTIAAVLDKVTKQGLSTAKPDAADDIPQVTGIKPDPEESAEVWLLGLGPSQETRYRIKRSTPMGEVIRELDTRFNEGRGGLCMYSDGRKIQPEDTMITLGLYDGARILLV